MTPLLSMYARLVFPKTILTRRIRRNQTKRCYSVFKYSHEVAQALYERNKPIVALESTIISHGMAWPINFDCAKSVENIVRENGAIPATIAILAGAIHIGLTLEQLENFARMPSKHVRKCSRRDLALAVGLKEHGATTVSGTMYLAHKCGISVFVTGGIGGVHRGAFGENGTSSSLDVSADLTELGRTPVTVVCAGVKSILDVPKSLEFLETKGVTVVTYSKDRDAKFPAFYTKESECASQIVLSSVEEIAEVIRANRRLKVDSGIVVAIPNPKPVDENLISASISDGIQAAEKASIYGKELTPFLLKYIADATKGVSASSNIELIKSNAEIGSRIASKLFELESKDK